MKDPPVRLEVSLVDGQLDVNATIDTTRAIALLEMAKLTLLNLMVGPARAPPTPLGAPVSSSSRAANFDVRKLP